MLFYFEGSSALAASNLQERINSMMVDTDKPILDTDKPILKEGFDQTHVDKLQNEAKVI